MCLLQSFWLLKTLPLLIIFGTKLRLIKSEPGDVIHLPFRKMNDYFYNWISTPNYPNKFNIPYNQSYIVNTTNLVGIEEPSINIYLTELYIDSEYISIYDNCNPPMIGWNTFVNFVSTEENYTEIHINITDLYSHHLRTRKNYNHYGFNISIEVVESSSKNQSNWKCSIRGCSFAGTCRGYPGLKSLEFRCDCDSGYWGSFCQYGPECDPVRNINFCLNGGECRTFGHFGGGVCKCPNGYGGNKCQIKPPRVNFVENGNNDCKTNEPNYGPPCSLCNEWKRYQLVWRNNKENIYGLENKLQHLFFPGFRIISQTNTNKELKLDIYGRKKEDSFPPKQPLPEGGISIIQSKLSDWPMNPEITINKRIPLKEREQFNLKCKSSIPSMTNKSLIDFKWFKDHVLIQSSFAISERYISHYNDSNLNETEIWSVLMIYNASPFDNGVFTCQVTDLLRNVQECVDFNVTVLLPPQIEVMPMSVTVIKNGSVLLSCSDGTESISKGAYSRTNTTWYKDGEIIRESHWGYPNFYRTEPIFPQGRLFRVLKAQESGTLSCEASNLAGTSVKEVKMEVLRSKVNPYESCNEIWEDFEEFRMSWGLTKIEQTAISKCPSGFVGFAQKKCMQGERDNLGEWVETDFSRCTHKQLGRLNFTLQSMKNGYNVMEPGLAILNMEMDSYLEMRRINPSSFLYGEGDKFITMLSDVFNYFTDLSSISPQLLSHQIYNGAVEIFDKLIQFQYSCVHPSNVLGLIRQLIGFIERHKINNFNGSQVHVSSLSLIYNRSESLVEINATTSILYFDYQPMDDGEKERQIQFIRFKGISELFRYRDTDPEKIISDVVSVHINGITSFSFKKGSWFEIEFEIKPGSHQNHKNLTCASLNNSDWEYNVCKLNITLLTVNCFCERLGVFAVLAVKENIIIPPKANELFLPPPNWISTSGCVVCLVLVLRSLVNSLLQRTYDSYYYIASGGIIFSMLSLLYLILVNESNAVGILYLTVTLLIKSLRIWRMIWIYDMNEMYPWLETSKWILLAGVVITLTLPLLTVYLFDLIYSDEVFLLYQDSHVFSTFFIIFCASVLAIIVVHYKTYLRVNGKIGSNNNHNGEHKLLNENFFSTLILLVQILSVLLYWNLKQHLIFHYFFAIANCIVGLSWKSPHRDRDSPKRTSSQSNQQLQLSEGCNQSISNRSVNTNSTNFGNFGNNQNKILELKPLSEKHNIGARGPSMIEEDEEHDHDMIFTNNIHPQTNRISTINKYGPKSKYTGDRPMRGKCLIRDDYNYVLPSS